MMETPLQLPERLSALKKKDRVKVLKQAERTILCIPDGIREPLTEKEVVAVLGVRRAVVWTDESTGGFWVRAGDEDHKLFFDHLEAEGLAGYTSRAVVRGSQDWSRLVEKLIDHGQSQGQNPTEEPIGSSSSSNPVNAQVGESSALPIVGRAEAGSPGPGLLEGSPRSASSEEEGGSDRDASSATEAGDGHRRKRARLAQGSTSEAVGSTSNTQQVKKHPALDRALAKLPNELIQEIFKLCLEDAATFKDYYAILQKFYEHGGRCRRILETTPSFWTRIRSSFGPSFMRKVLALSRDRPLHIKGSPDPTRLDVERFREFIALIKPHRGRSKSLSLVFPSEVLKTVKNYLEAPAPNLETLSLSMSDAALQTGLALPMADTLSEELGRPLEVLGRQAGTLRRLLLKNIPSFWDPSPFTGITELTLEDGIQLRYAELVRFLRGSSDFQLLHLSNIKFIGGGPQAVDEPVVLSHLKKLVLVEAIEPMGLGPFFLKIDAPACDNLELDVRPSVEVMSDPTLSEKISGPVKKALAGGKRSFLMFGSHRNHQSACWMSRDGGEGGVSEEGPSFSVSFRGRGEGLAGVLAHFVQRVRKDVGEQGEMVVDVGNSVSGAIAEPSDWDLDDIVPTLMPSFFSELNVVEVRADVVDGYLQHFKELLGAEESGDWMFDGLKAIQLRAIPDKELEVLPDQSAGWCLESLVSHVRQESDATSISITLRGSFTIQADTARVVDEKKKEFELCGVKLGYAGGKLYYRKEKGEKKKEKRKEND